MRLIDDLMNLWDDYKEDKHPFVVGLVGVIIIGIFLFGSYWLLEFITDILPPINPFIIFGIVILSFLIYKFGVWLKQH